jgi:diguanylate cyclase (GGDEF)-like protein
MLFSLPQRESTDLTRRFQSRRLRQVLVMAILAILASTTHNWANGRWLDTVMLLLVGGVLGLAYFYAQRERVALATALMLGSLTSLLTAMIWVDQGVRDPAMPAFPAILVFASMLGGRRLFIGLLAIMLLVVASVVAANVGGWHVNVVKPVTFGTLVDMVGILSVTGFSVWLLANDLRRALSKLESENIRSRQSQAHIEYLAFHDQLTGLPNRVLARDRFDQAIAHARRTQSLAALLYLDLDNFKTVNDSLGHTAGDELLRDVAARVGQSVRSTDTICRLGGDEFLLIVGDMADSDAVAATAAKLLELLADPFYVQGVEMTTSCSLGIALFPDDGGDFDTLLKRADMAMYRAKDAGRNAFRFFDADMNSTVVEHLHLISGMRAAPSRDEFMLHYQPQFNLHTGEIIGAEALIRWRHPELGLIPPGKFIPVAEKSGLIIEIGEWVIREACRQAAQWRADGLGELLVSVNLSPVQFRRDNVERLVLNSLDASGLSPHGLELELTESLLIEDSAQLTDMLRRLRNLGVSFSIDDFGTGYSNLGYLKRFEVERLKIDQSFVRRLTEDQHDEAIVKAITQMADSLGLMTVAEGVEDKKTLHRLQALGCDRGQGYYWSPALAPAEFAVFVRQHHPEAVVS